MSVANFFLLFIDKKWTDVAVPLGIKKKKKKKKNFFLNINNQMKHDDEHIRTTCVFSLVPI